MQASQPDVNSPFNCPLLVVAASFALGIVFGRLDRQALAATSLLLVAAGACLFAGLVALRARQRRASSLLGVCGFMFAGAAAGALFELRFAPNHISHLAASDVDTNRTVQLQGVVLTTPLGTPHGARFDLEAQGLMSRGEMRSVTGKVRLYLAPADDEDAAKAAGNLHLQYRDSIRAPVRLRRPHVYRNPGAFDYARYLDSIEDVSWEGTIKSPALVEKLPMTPPGRPRYDLASLVNATRGRLLRGIDLLYPPWSANGRDGAVLKAVLLGERSSLDSDTIEDFRRTGLYHLLVIAGLHVGLLAMLAEFTLRMLRLGEFTRSVLVLAFLLTYALLVEQRAPTLRATLMITAYLLGRFLYRQHRTLNAVGLAGLLLLLARPPWLFESGFQLSFSAALLIAGLVAPILAHTTEPYRSALFQIRAVDRDLALAPRLAQFRLDVRSLVVVLETSLPSLDRLAVTDALVTGPFRALLWAANIVLFSAILQLGLLLPMVEIFHRVTFAGIALNALAIPVMTALLAFAVPTVVLSATFPALALWTGKLVSAVLGVLFFLTGLPNMPVWLSYRVPDPPAWVAWGFALSVGAAAFALGWSRLGGFAACAMAGVVFATLLCLYPFGTHLPRGALEVTALDCGGGDALLVVLPDQFTMQFGACGGRGGLIPGVAGRRAWDPGENIVSPYLWSRGLQKIDVLVLTDAHADHMAGLSAIVENFRVGEFWHGEIAPTPAYEQLTEILRRRGVRVRQVAAGEVVVRGSASVQILWPPGDAPWSRNANIDDAVVARITGGQGTVLLPGDISSEAEEQLVDSRAPLASQLLKVTHQGAKSYSSPEFLARVSPRVALVSGEGSGSRSLPNPQTLARLRSVGARVFRPDLDGAVTVEMKDSLLSVHTYGAELSH